MGIRVADSGWPRVENMKDNFIVGTNQEARSALKTLLKIANPIAKKIADRLNMLSVLNTNDAIGNSTMCDDKIFLTIPDVVCVPPTRGFIFSLLLGLIHTK